MTIYLKIKKILEKSISVSDNVSIYLTEMLPLTLCG